RSSRRPNRATQPQQHDDGGGERDRTTEIINPADERSGERLGFAEHGGAEETAEISQRVDQPDAAGGGGVGEKQTRQRPKRREVGFHSAGCDHEAKERERKMPDRQR